ncbi:MAG: preprotein translocase subunit SecA [Candidatus Aminicenantes bacterium]|nr:MAG: preprotein translocase subunit SecA [Candidatus Aminicenantes bacterium]
MLNFILRKIIGSQNQRSLKKIAPVVKKIEGLEQSISALTNGELRAKTNEFRDRLSKNETLDSLLPEAFAVVREAGKRTINMHHFPVQLIGGIVLHQGKIAEMATGEGKTLVATLAAYLNSLSGKGVHIITVNDYLARRDRQWMAPIYEFLGLSVGAIQQGMEPKERRAAYNCDVTYGTNNEFGFDYLRDNMVVSIEDKVQRELHYGIVDEVDSILIDEARTPLIISGPSEESTDKYYKVDKIIPLFKRGERDDVKKEESGDFIVDEKYKTSYLTEEGEIKAAKLLGLGDMHRPETMEWKHYVNQALRAHNNYRRNVDYMLKDNQVVIVDEFTGRLMPGRRWSDGLHQAIEAKERVKIERENQTLATITFQNYFRMYEKLAGMTGTAATEASEFLQIYKLDVIVIPTNKPLRRTNYPDVIYKTEREKFNAVVKEIEELHKQGRPVLVGTVSIEKSERLSQLLKRKNIMHSVLNAKYHEREAEIVALAGQKNAVTIATNMAGRGTDIVLGKGITELGGLHIIGTERHEARRIDNQLRGRAGRQGDPGSSRFYLSLEDELMRLFGSERIMGMMQRLGMAEGQAIEHKLITHAITTAQKRVEAMNFDIRKQLLDYDNVMNKQREVIYKQRENALMGKNLNEEVHKMIKSVIERNIQIYLSSPNTDEHWDLDGLGRWLKQEFGIIKRMNTQEETRPNFLYQQIKEDLINQINNTYKKKQEKIGEAAIEHLEKHVMLQVIDAKWKEHLYTMDNLREGIGLRAYGQRDPLVEYQHESFAMFAQMMERIEEECLEFIFKAEPIREEEINSAFSVPYEFVHQEMSGLEKAKAEREKIKSAQTISSDVPLTNITYRRQEKKVGRNEPCPCGSGKKYKRCCGRNE